MMNDDNKEALEAARDDHELSLRRREFIGAMGAAFSVLSAGCGMRPPKEKIVPAADLPEGAVPGRADWYATTCLACPAACGALAKVRDGRPIKMEGNPDHPLSRGGLCARGQASVLDLYDSERYRSPMQGGSPRSWAEADALVLGALEKARASGRAVRVLTSTPAGLSERAALDAFCSRWGAKAVVYDPVSHEAILEAHRLTHGRRSLPRYHFAQAKVLVSFGADFLGTWLSPVEFTKDWAQNRAPSEEFDLMSWHAQFEARMSPTGANADLRVPLSPAEEGQAVILLGRLVASRTGWSGPTPPAVAVSERVERALRDAADLLAAAKGRALVVSGSAETGTQAAVNWINEMLGAYGTTLELARPALIAQGSRTALAELTAELASGKVGVLLVHGVNPAFDGPGASAFGAAAAKAQLVVSLASRRDETSVLAGVVAPGHHALESWGDAQPGLGIHSLVQPTVSPLFDTRAAAESLLVWAGRPASAYEHLRSVWRREVFSRTKGGDFEAFWGTALAKGALTVEAPGLGEGRFNAGSVAGLKARAGAADGFIPVFYHAVGLFDGRQANNPLLQELPDPVTKATWGNCASFAAEDAARLGLVEGRLVKLSAGAASAVLPAHIQPGQAAGTVAAALGYGRREAGAVAANFPTVKMFGIDKEEGGGSDLYPLSGAASVGVEVLAGMEALAKTQTQESLEEPYTGRKRDIVRETTYQEFLMDPRAGNPEAGKPKSLWPGHEYKGHKWAMAVDLSLCTGCSACVVSCYAENNVPIVGKAEVRKSRDMAWLRVDRYYSGDPQAPETAFQPMLCQHCDNAPCETVCPVLATVHSSEGLNMQVYNRCVGTRYCANNCPYKVRRFNWFDYAHEDELKNLQLNPDVSVRTRGVMEKCSFCVQRIYSAKADAKTAGRTLKGGEVQPACAQSCPANAIVFGDLNEEGSPAAEAAEDPRSYSVLAELGVGPAVRYRTKVRNKKV